MTRKRPAGQPLTARAARCASGLIHGRCKSARYARICPQHTRFLFDSHSGQGKCDLALAIIDGKMKWDDDPEIKDILFQCTMCGGCDAMDKNIRDAELVKLYRWMRAEYIKVRAPARAQGHD